MPRRDHDLCARVRTREYVAWALRPMPGTLLAVDDSTPVVVVREALGPQQCILAGWTGGPTYYRYTGPGGDPAGQLRAHGIAARLVPEEHRPRVVTYACAAGVLRAT